MCDARTSSLGSLWKCCKCGYDCNSLEFCRSCDHVVCERLPAENIPLLVVGCPRSGTKYTARLLQAAGAQVGHEWLFADGIVSCHMTVEHPRWRVPMFDGRYCSLRHYLFKRIYHQVREPLAAIASLRHWVGTPGAGLLSTVAEEVTTARIDQSPLERAMRLYIDWNLLAETVAHQTYKVESLSPNSATSKMISGAVYVHIGVEHYAEVPTNLNRTEGGKKPIDWSDLEKASPHLAARAKELGRRYGYRSG